MAEKASCNTLWGFTTWISTQEISCLTRVMAIMNSCDALLVMIAFPLGFGMGALEIDNLLNWMLLFYTMIFSSLLLFFHGRLANQAMLDNLRTYFGFMFSFSGRFSFLLFLALLCFSAANTWWYTITVGILVVIAAVINCVILCAHPAFASGGSMAAGIEEGGLNQSRPQHSTEPAAVPGGSYPAATSTGDVTLETGGAGESNPFGDATMDNSTAAAPAPAPAAAEAPSAAAWDSAGGAGTDAKQVTALYKFEADVNDPDQLSMVKGDVLTLIERQSDGWARVVKNGKEGVVPVKYIST